MLGGIRFDITASSFFQVNTEQAENLYEKARDMGVHRGDAVLDLYCGVGGLTLFLASRARRVLGIENVPEAIACAEANAAANDIGNVRFLQAEARRAVKRLASGGKTYDVVTINPPRSGIHEDIVSALPDLSPRRIVYISCNPTTLARDLAGIVARGFRLTDVQPVDMFPHSYHVETIARLEREGS
jgi:23S rRNA (uracil1939-C5)-methyltransferase